VLKPFGWNVFGFLDAMTLLNSLSLCFCAALSLSLYLFMSFVHCARICSAFFFRSASDLSDTYLMKTAEQISAQWTKNINKYRSNERTAQKQRERMFNKVIASKK